MYIFYLLNMRILNKNEKKKYIYIYIKNEIKKLIVLIIKY